MFRTLLPIFAILGAATLGINTYANITKDSGEYADVTCYRADIQQYDNVQITWQVERQVQFITESGDKVSCRNADVIFVTQGSDEDSEPVEQADSVE